MDDTDPEELDNALEDARIDVSQTAPPAGDQRRGAVLAALRARRLRRVGDLGCGDGALVRELLPTA